MGRNILVTAVFLLAIAGIARAQDSALHGSVDFTYQSKYVWRGFDVYNDKSAMQPSLDLDLFGSGFGINMMGHRANSDGFEGSERWDYTLYYQNMICPEETYAMMYRLGWVYYNYPQHNSEDADLQEMHAVVSLPKMCTAGVVPSYVLVKLWPNSSGSFVAKRADLSTGLPSSGTASGWAHIFMLDYPLTIGGVLPDTPEQVLNMHAEVVFNDGVGPAGQDVDQDWSNAVFGVSTGINLADGLVFTPGVYYQVTMEDTVNDDKDEIWTTFSMTYKF